MKSHASMNRIYRLVWNAALNLWVAVAENARGRGKSGSARNKAALLMLVPLSALMHPARAADAANASVVSGAGTVATSGLTTTINQATQKLAIDWTSLSTAANEALKFNQPNAQAIALNRITGASPSELLGSLTANGQVFILNPNGVLFGAGSQVNVGGLVASTLSMSNADFMAGNNVFNNNGGSGLVVNQGSLNAGQGGYLALLAPEVRNEGVMTASLGTALLAAGNKVTLNLDNGSLLGYSIDQGAINALAENKQLIKADGGQVLLSAKAMNSLTTATVNNTGIIEARTLQNKAGRIMLMGDMEFGTVNVGGTLDASAPNGGDGGFIETSAANVKVAEGTKVLALAANGTTGKWLVDPKDFTVAATGGDMTGATLSTNLGTANVELQSSGGGTAGSGDININDAVSWSANTLTLTAARDINFGAVASATGTAGLVMKTSTANGADAAAAGGLVKMALGPSGFTGRVDMATGTSLNINNESYVIVNSLGVEGVVSANDLQGFSGTAKSATNFVLGSDIDASASSTWNSGAGFLPISAFTARFNGLGHTITNLTINRPSTGAVGLFGSISAAGNVRVGNVGLVGGSFTGATSTGALVGSVAGTTGSAIIYNSFSTANVTGTVGGLNAAAGGLVGAGGIARVLNSYATGNVTGLGTASSQAVGGLVGLFAASAVAGVTNSYATGNVSTGGAGALLGGLVGWTATNNTISGSYATGLVTSSGTVVGTGGIGGLVGNATGTTITDSYATGAVASTNDLYVGGLVGTSSSGLISTSRAEGTVTASNIGGYTGGLVGRSASTSINASYAIGQVSGAGAGVGGLVGYAVGITGSISASYATGAVTSTGTVTGTAAGGLVGVLSQTSITGSYATGPVLGSSSSAALTTAGGLVGNVFGSTIDLSYATGTVRTSGTGSSGTLYMGGLVGNLGSGSISNSYATGAVTGPTMVGGLVGSAGIGSSGVLSIATSYASGAVTNLGASGTATAGGLVGYSEGPAFTISNSYATGNVAGGAAAGGIGGLIGGTQSSASTSVSNSYATGVVSGTGTRGGLSGVGGTFTNSFWNAATSTAAFGIGSTSSNAGATGLTSAQFMSSTTFIAAGWNVSAVGGSSAVWRIYEGHSGPLLRSMLRVVTLADAADASVGYNGSAQAGATTAGAVAGVLGAAATGRNAGFYNGYYSTQKDGLDIIGGNLTIAKANLTVSSSDVNRVYDTTTTAAGSAVVTGGTLFGSDALNGGAFAFTDKNAGTGKTVNVSGITVADGNGGGNYTITQVNNTSSTITQASLAVTGVTAQNKVYDTSTSATLGGTAAVAALGSDVISVVGTGAGVFADKNAGNGKAVTVSGFALTGTDALNYAIVQPTSVTATITKADLAVTGVTAQNRVYDGSTSATLGGTAGVTALGSDVISVVGTGAGVFADKNAGNGKAVTVSGYTLGGTDAANYAIVQPASVTANITKADLTVTANGINKVYDGSTVATVGYGDNRVAGDVLGITGSGSFADKNAGAAKTVNVGGISLSGADAGNYNLLNTTAGTTADISRASLTVVAGDATRMADGTAYSGGNGVSYLGLMGGDTAAMLGGALAYGGSSQGASTAGSYDITLGGLSANGNYNLRFVQGRLTLTPGGAESSALGGTELVGAYRGSLNTLGNSGLLPHVSVDDGKGNGGGDGAATALNAAAAGE